MEARAAAVMGAAMVEATEAGKGVVTVEAREVVAMVVVTVVMARAVAREEEGLEEVMVGADFAGGMVEGRRRRRRRGGRGWR